ncbi:MAG TPA: sugar phosphate isomerase, partial [Armatimonadetes bacterium]|nr:sugar phosphate isomerase [Armatimonadota bacterium]
MDRTHHSDIRIGTLVPLKESVSYIPQIHGHGFESYQLNSWAELPFTNFDEHAAQVRDIIGDQAVI